MSANNVLKFPNIGKVPTARNMEELSTEFLNNKKNYVDHVVDHYGTQLINKLGLHGFDIYEENFIIRYSYTIESLRACLYGTLDIEHPFIEHMEDMLEMLPDPPEEIEDLDDE